MDDDTAEIKEGQDRYRELQRQAAAGEEKRFKGKSNFGPRTKFTKISNSILHDNTLTSQEKLTLCVILEYGQKTGECRKKIKIIIEETGLGRIAVFKALKSLELKGWIEIKKTNGAASRYFVLKFENSLFK